MRRRAPIAIVLAILATTFLFTSTANAQTAAAAQLKLPAGFQGELLYSVPESQGSWVSLTHDPQGRLITSDQYGKLYRITPGKEGTAEVEPLELEMGFAQGLLCAFDSLYVVCTGVGAANKPPGLYRVRDTDNDDKYDKVELLREFHGSSEHGPHAVVLGPDGKSLYVCAGNHTQTPKPETSRVPRNWQEDQLLTRLPDPRGHAVGIMAPAGWICKTDPEGKSFELVAMGFRNTYDLAFDPNGELFTYDADMEWDVGLPWYRPTRVCQAVSGSDFGWRYGSGKWPEYYADSVPPVKNVGPGSPTGIAFGTGAKFPAKYQNSLFVADWSYGIIYAVHMAPNGATYAAELEQFCSAPALPVTDMVVNSVDGKMYFAVGGRRLQSALYRISYVGDEPTEPADYPAVDATVKARRKLESYHVEGAKPDMDFVWKQLGSEDRLIRYAARIAVEHQPVETWAERALQETNSTRSLETLMALVRCSEGNRQAEVVAALDRLKWKNLTEWQQLHLLRDYSLVLCRLGEPTRQTKQTIQKLASYFPNKNPTVNLELAKLLIAVDTPQATGQVVDMLLRPSSQEMQIAYAKMLADAKAGWNLAMREKYFQWFVEMAQSRGGASYGGFLKSIKDLAISRLNPEEKTALADVINRKPKTRDVYAGLKSRPFVKKWNLDELLPIEKAEFKNRDLQHGKKLFAVATCYKCHRIAREGGMVGPDLTNAGRRLSTKDLLETVVNPNKEISDQYQATIFLMEDGRVVVGRVANLNGKSYSVLTDMTEPGNFTNINADEIEEMMPSDTSMMPTGLLDTLTKEEILDLLAYMKSTAEQ